MCAGTQYSMARVCPCGTGSFTFSTGGRGIQWMQARCLGMHLANGGPKGPTVHPPRETSTTLPETAAIAHARCRLCLLTAVSDREWITRGEDDFFQLGIRVYTPVSSSINIVAFLMGKHGRSRWEFLGNGRTERGRGRSVRMVRLDIGASNQFLSG